MPKTPPHINMPIRDKPRTQTTASHHFQKSRMDEKIHKPIRMTVAASGRQCCSYGYVPNRMKRCFSVMRPQQAPCVSRHAFASGFQTASRNAQSMNGGIVLQMIHRMTSVAIACGHEPKKFSRIRFKASSFHHYPRVVPVHER